MIELQALRKEFGSFVAVQGISLKIDKGEVLGFLGPNGAGKSTTMKMVAGFLTPTSGTAIVAGHDVLKDPLAVKTVMGYLPEGAPLYPDMTPEGLFKFVAQARGMASDVASKRTGFVVDRLQLASVIRQPIETLSKGFKRRVGLAQAILHDPPVLILDEPTDGLDPNQKHQVRGLIQDMAKDKCIILSTHILEEVESVCTRAAIVARGRVVADETPAKLASRSKLHNAVCLKVRPPQGVMVFDELRKVAGVAEVEGNGTEDGIVTCRVIAKGGKSIVGDVSQLVRNKAWEVKEMTVESGRLDDVFRDITAAGGVA
ncbi:MAG: ABC transporter ATP-binding protein [Planctomycetes bacterium]|nr:ABC transporter ATP-binding protein [Planctomycetota bacterium]